MNEKTKALKTASKVISVFMKIGYIATIIAMSASAVALIFMGLTGGKTAVTTSGGMNIIIADGLNMTPETLTVLCIELLIMSGFFFAILLPLYRMFHEISVTGDPFTEKYVRTVKVSGILIAAATVVGGIADEIVGFVTKADTFQLYTEAPGVVVGAIVFCLAYIIDYGCALKNHPEESK